MHRHKMDKNRSRVQCKPTALERLHIFLFLKYLCCCCARFGDF